MSLIMINLLRDAASSTVSKIPSFSHWHIAALQSTDGRCAGKYNALSNSEYRRTRTYRILSASEELQSRQSRRDDEANVVD
jgi:hypothetical protein